MRAWESGGKYSRQWSWDAHTPFQPLFINSIIFKGKVSPRLSYKVKEEYRPTAHPQSHRAGPAKCLTDGGGAVQNENSRQPMKPRDEAASISIGSLHRINKKVPIINHDKTGKRRCRHLEQCFFNSYSLYTSLGKTSFFKLWNILNAEILSNVICQTKKMH